MEKKSESNAIYDANGIKKIETEPLNAMSWIVSFKGLVNKKYSVQFYAILIKPHLIIFFNLC